MQLDDYKSTLSIFECNSVNEAEKRNCELCYFLC